MTENSVAALLLVTFCAGSLVLMFIIMLFLSSCSPTVEAELLHELVEIVEKEIE